MEKNSCFHFHKVVHLVLVLLALFAPKEAVVERDVEEGENKKETSDPQSFCELSTTTSSEDLVNVFAKIGRKFVLSHTLAVLCHPTRVC